jgi:serine/threonine protein kinase
MQAKIADLGTARMIGTQKLQVHTPTPGTPMFMPPEACVANPKYDAKLDIFSFGQVTLHTLTQVYPYEILPSTHLTPSGKIKGRSELERRERYMELLYSQLKEDHQLSKLVASCFENEPRRRPTAKEVMSILEEFILELKNAGKKLTEMTKFIQDADVEETSKSERFGESMILTDDGTWDFKLRKRSATFIDSHILVS